MTSLTLRFAILKLLMFSTIWRSKTMANLPLKGRHFKMAVWEQQGCWKFLKDSNGTVIGYSGVFNEIVQWLSERLQFTYTVVPIYEYREGPFPNGTWVGGYEMIRLKEVDFITSSISVNPTTKKILDFTYNVAEPEQVFLVPPQKEESRLLTPFKPFSLTVWMLVVGSVVAISAAIYGIVKVEQKIYPRRRKSRRLFLTDAGLTVTGVTFGQNEFSSLFKQTGRMRILVGLFCLTLVVTVNSYTGTFISFATTPTVIPLPKNAEDVAFRSGLRYITLAFQDDSPYSSFRKLAEYLYDPKNIFPSEPSLMEEIATGCCAFLYPKIPLNLWVAADFKATGKCRFGITQEAVALTFHAFGCQKGSRFCQTLSKEVMLARDMGLVSYWWGKEVKSAYQCQHPEKPKYRRLTTIDLSGVFLLFIGGVSFSAMVFFIEVLFGRTTRTTRRAAVSMTQSSRK